MRILILGLLFLTFFSQAQEQELEIISLKTDDRILHGEIGEKYPITIYLKVSSYSDNVGWIYGVSGWYQYDNIGTPIPLVGMWGGGQLYLFVSEDSKFIQNMKELMYENDQGTQYLDNFIFDMQTLTPQLPEINERFYLEFGEQGISGNWNNKEKGFSVSVNGSDSQIVKETDYLKLPNGSHFNLLNAGIPPRASFEIEAAANEGKHVILGYAYHANLNYNGRCGGAETSGKLGLVFNDSYQLLGYTNAEFMNCYRDLSVDDLEKVSETVTDYKIQDYGSSKEVTYRVDSKSATIKTIEE